ncbi:MAG: hypothetical protein M3419_12465 [Actinomycetota bacterium]|nr:hypothetical protein [Actinomycetota bacterium]
MDSTGDLVPGAELLADPVLEHAGLGVSPLLVAVATSLLVLVVGFALPVSRLRPTGRVLAAPDAALASWYGSLSRFQVGTRVLAVAVLLVAIAAARLGVDDQLENLAPALVVGAAWPVLVLLSVVIGPVWRWLDPWDGLARLVTGDEPGEAPEQVWLAVLLALPLVWYLSAAPDPLEPRPLGLALSLYTVVTVAGCVAFGRARWLAHAEPVGIVLSWMSLLPRGRLPGWSPPRGAEALLGVLVGGVAFGALRRSEQWTSVNAATGAWEYATVALLGACAVAAGFLVLAHVMAVRVGGQAGVARAVVPAAAAVVVAAAMGRNRLTSSVQLLPGLLGDPFGAGWDLLGPAADGLNPEPLGSSGLLAAQIAVLVVGHLVGAVVVARCLERRARIPAVVVVAVLLGVSIATVPWH